MGGGLNGVEVVTDEHVHVVEDFPELGLIKRGLVRGELQARKGGDFLDVDGRG
jgi:hypothetical protein